MPDAIDFESADLTKLDFDGPNSIRGQFDDYIKKTLDGHKYPNMDELPILNQATTLGNLEMVFYSEQPKEKPSKYQKVNPVYTQVGATLISINPFARFECFGPDWEDAYHKLGREGTITTGWRTYGPHCYCTVEEVYQNLKKKSLQSVVICGESGAGKTYTNKLMINYLLDHEAQANRIMSGRSGTRKGSRSSIRVSKQVSTHLTEYQSRANKKDQLEAANEVLEAYGNAKTCRNDNSSRFGKYSQLYFKDSLVSAIKVEHYLLERSRLVRVPVGERNYHIVHYLALEESGVTFRYLEGGARTIMQVNGQPFADLEEFEKLKQRMSSAGFKTDMQTVIYSCIKGIMFLGNTDFDEVVDDGNDAAKVKETPDFLRAAELLKIEPALLAASITTREVRVGKERTVSPVNRDAAIAQRDTMSKTVYSKIFDLIVGWLNQHMGGNQSIYGDMPCIGMLDIFGFEDMPVNGFEQMFINLTNEWIQDHFNHVMFTREMEIYDEEGIGKIDFVQPSNFQAVELFTLPSNPVGIIKILQENVLNKGSSRDGAPLVEFMTKDLKDHPNFQEVDSTMLNKVMKEKKAKWGKAGDVKLDYKACFAVKHYAGSIVYFCSEFLPKSQDSMADHLAEAVASSQWTDLAGMFETHDDSSKSKKQMTVGQHFVQQLTGLMHNLKQSQSLFVRCIKPNAMQAPGRFTHDLVVEQLVCGGVMSALEMRRVGLPDRMTYEDFCQEFGMLQGAGLPSTLDAQKTQSRTLMEMMVGKEDAHPILYKFGHTRLFLRSGVLNILREAKVCIRKRCGMIVARKWRAKVGLSNITALENSEERVDEVRELAQTNKVNTVRVVERALKEAQEAIDAAFARIEGEAGAWTDIKGYRQRAKNEQLSKEHEVVVGNVQVDMGAINLKVESVVDLINLVCKRRQLAEERVGEMVMQRRQKVNAQMARIEEVLKYCQPSASGQDPPEQKQLFDKCKEVHAKLEETADKEFSGIQEETMAGVDLDTDAPAIELPKSADEAVARGEKLVVETENLGKGLVEARKKFLFDTMMKTEELKLLFKQLGEAKVRLEYLEQDSQGFVRDGLNTVADAIAHAQDKLLEIDAIVQEGLHGEKLKECIADFLVAEAIAQKAVETAKQLEEEAAERDQQYLQTIYTSFGQRKEMVQVYQALMAQIENLTAHIEDKEDESSVDGLGNENAFLKELKVKLAEAQESMANMGVGVLDQTELAGKKLRFNFKGPWNAECFHLLGDDISAYKDLCTVLDQDRFRNVMDAVEALNAGVIKPTNGYIMGKSVSWNQYYMLFQKEEMETVNNMLDRARHDEKANKRDVHLTKIANTVHGALKGIDKQELYDRIRREREAHAQQIRDRMQKEMEVDFTQRADMEVEEKTQKIKRDVAENVQQAQGDLAAAAARRQKAKARFEQQIADLKSKVDTFKAPASTDGLMPQVHEEINAVSAYCDSVRKSLLNLTELGDQEAADTEEALAFMDALINNPKKLPGFHSFVGVLGRCQKRHVQSEDMTLEVGLDGQHSALMEAREEMIKIAGKIKCICDGTVKHEQGLETELLEIQVSLKKCLKTFEMLCMVFHNWTTRMDRALDCIQMAIDCVNVKVDEVPHLKAHPNGNKSRTVWKRVMESFCTADHKQAVQKIYTGSSLVKLEGAAVKSLMSGIYPNKLTSRVGRESHTQFTLTLGDVVEDLATRQLRGVVRFLGPTTFAAGDWVGIELEAQQGKTDGSVNGQRYFECPQGHGLFMRPKALNKVFGNNQRTAVRGPKKF